jgi:hypothetical protein
VSDTPGVTTLALLNLIRLLAAELVAGEHRDDATKLIQAIDIWRDVANMQRADQPQDCVHF